MEVINRSTSLPESAYEALEGIKGQAKAAALMLSAHLSGGDDSSAREALIVAQDLMAANEIWVYLILDAMEGADISVDELNIEWLEKTFSDGSSYESV